MSQECRQRPNMDGQPNFWSALRRLRKVNVSPCFRMCRQDGCAGKGEYVTKSKPFAVCVSFSISISTTKLLLLGYSLFGQKAAVVVYLRSRLPRRSLGFMASWLTGEGCNSLRLCWLLKLWLVDVWILWVVIAQVGFTSPYHFCVPRGYSVDSPHIHFEIGIFGGPAKPAAFDDPQLDFWEDRPNALVARMVNQSKCSH